MLLSEVIQRVQSIYSHGVQSDDSRLASRHTYSAIKTARSILIKQKSDKKQSLSQWGYQILPCVELVKVPVHECPCVPPTGCMILRSKSRIPDPIMGMDGPLIQSITTLDGDTRYSFTRFENRKYSIGNKFTSKSPNAFIKDGYLYLTVLKQLKAITISGLFNDYLEARAFPSACGDCEGCDCEDIMETVFPIDGDQIRPLIQLANEELVILMKQITQDKNNDATDDGSIAGNMVHQPQQPD